jgi:colanic acid biosynthesis glycosyl transferase WcaI
MSQHRPSVIILYHFFYPDDVVSARHYSQFAEGLVKHGWRVTVLTSNRYCRNSKKKILNRNELWQGIQIIRIRRPAWDQTKVFLRIANSAWMTIAWGLRLCRLPRADVIIIGSDPQFSALLFPIARILRRGKVLVHWCYDLYPEAIIADGAKGFVKWIAEKLTILMCWAYHSVDLMVDIGECMKKRLSAYHHNARSVTLVPWALVELDSIQKPDEVTRRELFSDAKLAILYSGNMGRAHDFSLILQLARRLYNEDPKIVFCFACRGNRYRELTAAVRPGDYNIRFAPFAEGHELPKRLNSADIHLISLRHGWEGIVVPSKFFGSLAVGRPVLYAGPEGSAIYKWIQELNIGMVINKDNMEDVVSKLINLANQPDKMRIWGENAFKAYKYFSRTRVINQWDKLLKDLMNHNVNCDVSNRKTLVS